VFSVYLITVSAKSLSAWFYLFIRQVTTHGYIASRRDTGIAQKPRTVASEQASSFFNKNLTNADNDNSMNISTKMEMSLVNKNNIEEAIDLLRC